jgi:hypothetical protein
MRRVRTPGFSVAEVMVASGMFLLLMLVGLGTLQVIKRTGAQLKGRSVPRQQLRALFLHLQKQVRAANFIFDIDQPVDFGSDYSHTYTGAPDSDPGSAGVSALLWAIPESADAAPTYRLHGLFLQPDATSDKAFEGAHSVISAQVPNLVGATPGSPADLPLTALPTDKTTVRNFQIASPADGLRIHRSESGDGLIFQFVIGHETEGESLVFETYTSHLTMRNNR